MNKTIPVLAIILFLALTGSLKEQTPGSPFCYEFAPSCGELKLLVLLMRFPEDKPEVSPGRVEDIFFSSGKMPNGSVAEYFHEVSYGELKISGEVHGWYTAEHSHEYYAANSHGHNASLYPRAMSRLIEEAVFAARSDGIDFSAYDNSGDGHVDGLIVIHSGRGGSTSGDPDHIWTTVHYLSMGGTSPMEVNGKIIDRFTIIQEIRRPGVELPIGFICHELGHVMGLPDLAGWGPGSASIGRFGPMGTGFRGSKDPTRPFQFCAFSKTKLGWINPVVVTSDTVVSIPDIESHPVAYRINCPAPDEYFLVSNRQRRGYDSELFGQGLLIWHVYEGILTEKDHESVGRCPYHYIVALEQADGKNDLEKNKNRGDAHDFFTLEDGSSRRWAGDTGVGEDFLAGAHSLTYAGNLTGASLELLSGSTDAITARIRVHDTSHPSPSSPHISIADFRIKGKTKSRAGARETREEFEVSIKIRNIGAPAERIRVIAEASGIWFGRAQARIARLGTGEEKWLDKPFTYKMPREFGPSRPVNFKFSLSTRRNKYRVTLNKVIVVGRPGILLLDDTDRGMDFFYSGRLRSIKEPFWCWRTREDGLPGFSEVAAFPILIWVASLWAESAGEVLDTPRRSLLQKYLNQGGNLLLIAPHLAFENDMFWSEVLHLAGASPQAGIAGLRGIDTDVISHGHLLLLQKFYYPWLNPHSSMELARDAVPIYHDLHGHVVGMRYPARQDAANKIVILSFPLEALGVGHQCQVLRRILQFFRLPLGAPVAHKLMPARIPRGAGKIKVTLSGVNFQQGIVAGFEKEGIRIERVKVISPEEMELLVDVSKTASLGPCTLILLKPGMAPVRFPEALTITTKAEL